MQHCHSERKRRISGDPSTLPQDDRSKEVGMKFFKLIRNKKGQSATEYMLVLAVIVLALVAAASNFIPIFKNAVASLAHNVAAAVSKDQTMIQP